MSLPPNIVNQPFLIHKHPVEPWVLIYPGKGVINWSPSILYYRSRIQDSIGSIVSIGFPKFFNIFDRDQDTKKLQAYIDSGKSILYSDKKDGCLIIRSSYNDKVIIRTRGSFDLSGLPEKAQDEVMSLMPTPLLESKNYRNISLLFEYTSPNNRIIVDYDRPNLTYLGYIDHTLYGVSPSYLPIVPDSFFEQFFSSPDIHSIKVSSIPELCDFVLNNTHNHPEGIVLYLSGTLIKLKNLEYLHKHRMIYNVTPTRVYYICLINRIYSRDQFDTLIQNIDIDEELFSIISIHFNNYVDAIQILLKELSRIKKVFQEKYVQMSPKEMVDTLRADHDFDLFMALKNQNPKKIHQWVLRELKLPMQKDTFSALSDIGFNPSLEEPYHVNQE